VRRNFDPSPGRRVAGTPPPRQQLDLQVLQALELHKQGHLARAQAMYEAVLKRQPRHFDALQLMGALASQTNNPVRALELMDKAIAIDRTKPRIHLARASVLSKLGQFEAALAGYNEAIRLKPDYAEAYCDRGIAFQEREQWEAALASYDQAITLRPNYPEAHNNRGDLLNKLNQWDAALASFDRAIAARPGYAVAHFNRGVLLHEARHLREALDSYNRAIAIQGNYGQARFNRAAILLLTGDYANGLIEYEWRLEYQGRRRSRDLSQPLWLGNGDLRQKTILVYSEQGLGDTLQFCRYTTLLAALGARVVLEAQQQLLVLLDTLEGVSQVLSTGSSLQHFDYHCPLASLPLAFRTSPSSIPACERYLQSDARLVDRWHSRLGAKSKPRIGLAWSGNRENSRDARRSIALQSLIEHLPGRLHYFCLQTDVRDSDQRTLDAHAGITNFADELNFPATAALCQCMDLVISVDTSVAHLSGALGVETWILLPFLPDWRWMLDRDDSPWYPTARLYRQQDRGDWLGVIRTVSTDLLRRFGN
jgi:tetratricopeptide (TPR) repeat protein